MKNPNLNELAQLAHSLGDVAKRLHILAVSEIGEHASDTGQCRCEVCDEWMCNPRQPHVNDFVVMFKNDGVVVPFTFTAQQGHPDRSIISIQRLCQGCRQLFVRALAEEVDRIRHQRPPFGAAVDAQGKTLCQVFAEEEAKQKRPTS